jgi:hypothetical protein
MRRAVLWFVLAYCFAAAVKTYGADRPSLDPHLEPLRPLLEKTWKGRFEGGKSDNPMVDVARWERALNGKAVRVRHSVSDGVYGGEAILRWDEKKQAIVYYYFTTARFMTVGSMTCSGGKFTVRETVEGNANGVTEVRSTTELLADGTLHRKAEFLVNGKWQPGHEIKYREDSTAKVVYK